MAYRLALIEKGILKLPMNTSKRNHIGLGHTEQIVDRTLEACETVLKQIGNRAQKPGAAAFAGR